MDIIKGKVARPIRALAYGPEGIGKSTFASQWPAPLFIDAEKGSGQLDVARIEPESWSMILAAITDLGNGIGAEYRTIVIDTADWAEHLCVDHVCAKHKQVSIEGFGYGKGYTYLAEEWKRFLDALTVMQDRSGRHVLLLGHACMRKFEQPEEGGQYDRWELKLTKQVAPAIKEWADLVLFLNYEIIVVEVDGRNKAQGGKRVMHAEHHPCWDAKNRYGLPGKMALEFKPVAHLFAASAPKVEPKPAPDVIPEAKPAEEKPIESSAPKAEPKSDNVPMPEALPPEKVARLRQIAQLMRAANIEAAELVAELKRLGVCPADTQVRNLNEKTLDTIIGNWDKLAKNIAIMRAKNAAA